MKMLRLEKIYGGVAEIILKSYVILHLKLFKNLKNVKN